jgi:hypothetical protein
VALADLGSADLGYLSTGGALAAIERPFFFAARVQAAEAEKAPAVRVRLLSDAIAVQPQADSARVALFRAAADARRWSLAVAALTPLLEPANPYYAVREFAGEGDAEEPEAPAAPPTFLARVTLEPAERTLLARTLADALQKLDRLPEAQTYFSVALRLESAPAAQTQIRQRLAGIRAELARRAKNEAHRPRVSPNLEQDRLVRPQVLAKSAPTPRPAPQGGTPR